MHTKEKGGVDGFIRKFRALVLMVMVAAVGYFVYSTTTDPGSSYPFKLGLDLAGGSHLVYEADVSGIDPTEVPELMEVLRMVIERRVNVFGVSEPIVQVERSSRVAEVQSERLIIELPGVADVKEAVREIGETPLLEFKLIDSVQAAQVQVNVQESLGVSPDAAQSAVQNFLVENGGYKDTGLTGRYLRNAEVLFGQNSGGGLSNEPVIAITFDDEGAALFEKITRENTGKQLAIFLDGQVISSPQINEPISGGRAIISGGFTLESARELKDNLNFGALPMPIHLVSTQTVGASLGERAIEASTVAGIVGLAAIGLFMILWYRLPGVVAAISLTAYVILMLALFKLIPVTLTAAGLAGLVLSIGLAVDANILISERLKEALQAGKGVEEAIEEGFREAWTSIRDGNLVNVLSGVILYWFGDVFIEGFAFMLIIGTIVSLLSSLIISRTLLHAISPKSRSKTALFLMGSGIHL